MDLFKYMTAYSLMIFLIGCSTDPAEIKDTAWKCNNNNKIDNLCNVSFSITNTSHLPIKCLIRIRAHNRKSVMGSDAVQNIVVGDKLLESSLSPGQTQKISQVLQARGRVTNIVVTTTSNEQ